jgi:hypothetical protein
MHKINISIITLLLGIAFSPGAIGQSVSKEDYLASKEKIATHYKAAIVGCKSLSGNASDICMAEAKGKKKTDLADLEVLYRPTHQSHYRAHVAKAEGNFAEGKARSNDQASKVDAMDKEDAQYKAVTERCDTYVGGAKDRCREQARNNFGK